MIQLNQYLRACKMLAIPTAAIVISLLGSTPVSAGLPQLESPGDISGTTLAKQPELAGTVVQDVNVPVSIQLYNYPAFNLVIEDKVVRETNTNFIDFYFRITAPSPNPTPGSNGTYVFNQFSLIRYGYSDFTIQTNYLTDQGGVGAPIAGYKDNVSDASITEFKPLSLSAGTQNSTEWVFIHTESRLFQEGSQNTIFGFINAQPFQTNNFSLAMPEAEVKNPGGGHHRASAQMPIKILNPIMHS